MKVLHIHPAMSGGGIEAMICGLANEMVKTDDVTVCSMFEPSNNDVFWNKLDSRVNRVTLGKHKQGLSFRTILKIWKLIRKGSYDAVNLHGFFYYYVLSVYLLRKKTCFFYTVHSDARRENSSWSRYVFFLKKRAFVKGYLHPITISPASNNSFKQLYGVEGKMIENGIPQPVVSNRINLIDEIRITPRTKVFVHPGRITEAKNQVVLCRVFDALVKEGRDLMLVIAGNKQDPQIFNAMQPYFCDRIRYLGERTDIPDLLSRCDGMCLPSIWEGLPVTLLEAFSVGCVPICSPVGGVVDVISNGVNGILSLSSSYEDYIAAMRNYLDLSPEEVSGLKQGASQSFEKFDVSIVAKRYLAYYEEIKNNCPNKY